MTEVLANQQSLSAEGNRGVGFSYSLKGEKVQQVISIGEQDFVSTRDIPSGKSSIKLSQPDDLWWKSYLLGNPIENKTPLGRISFIDLFCASGGLSLGFREAAQSLGFSADALMGVDMDQRALEVYRQNHDPLFTSSNSVDSLIDFQLSTRSGSTNLDGSPELLTPELKGLVNQVDFVLAGPPCQGNSSLNNALRYDDPRNRFYIYPVAIAIALGAKGVLIENVPGVKRDKGTICQRAEELLRNSGYSTIGLKIKAEAMGWPQTRHRYFLLGVRGGDASIIENIVKAMERPARPVSWAIQDLLKKKTTGIFDSTPEMSEENQRRIEWLFTKDENGEERFNLDDSERPDCHRVKAHTYQSSYGRMRWDRPSGTITTGFQTPGRGRFVHPKEPRVLTPHEASRIQGFPDGYFTELVGALPLGRTEVAKWVGDAVPAPLGFAAALGLLSQFPTV